MRERPGLSGRMAVALLVACLVLSIPWWIGILYLLGVL